MENTLFISDLHAGSPLFDNLTYLTKLIQDERFDRVVVVGDVIDVWEYSVDRILNMKLEPIETLRRLNKPVFILKGNHDPDYETLRFIFPSATIISGSLILDGMVILHGDEFDEAIIRYSRAAKILHYIHWLLERLNINLKAFFRELFYSVAAKRSSGYYNDLVYDIMEKVIIKYGKYGNTIVTGHTHMPMIANYIGYPDVKYINCGDWVHNFSYVEFIDGKFTLKKLG